MALGSTMYRFAVNVSDVDRGVYELLDLRLACHPSESMRYLITRMIAYCLSYEEGITFSKGGLSAAEDAPITIHSPTGLLLAWIDIGSPSPERLHKASKAAERVSIFTYAPIANLRREVAKRNVYKIEAIDVWHLDPAFLDTLEPKLDRHTTIELVRNDGTIYVTIDGVVTEGPITRYSLVEDQSS